MKHTSYQLLYEQVLKEPFMLSKVTNIFCFLVNEKNIIYNEIISIICIFTLLKMLLAQQYTSNNLTTPPDPHNPNGIIISKSLLITNFSAIHIYV